MNFFFSILAAIALVVMVNYLASGYAKRCEWAANTQAQLSPQTLRVLETLTNDINVTVFFDAKAEGGGSGVHGVGPIDAVRWVGA